MKIPQLAKLWWNINSCTK